MLGKRKDDFLLVTWTQFAKHVKWEKEQELQCTVTYFAYIQVC